MRQALVFGATGQIGGAIAAALAREDHAVVGVGRAAGAADGCARVIAYDPFEDDGALRPALAEVPPGGFDAVVWAQGVNCNDSLLEFDADQHLAVLKANTVYVAHSMAALLREDLLAPGARLCVISSIWQTIARQNKLSYTVSKAALQGLVLSASVDLAAQGYLVNAIMPGALDTPMTRSVLSAEQIAGLAGQTRFDRLASPDDVAELAAFLCSPANRSITGQFIAVDLGFQHARLV